MNRFSLLFLLVNFSIFIIGALSLFSRPKDGQQVRTSNSIFILSMMGLTAYGLITSDYLSLINGVLGLGCLSISLILFFWTAHTHRGEKLSPLNSLDLPTHLVQRGAYRYIRHPFYTSYVLSFLGGAILANSLWLMLGVLGIFYMYVEAADQEEEKFATSSLSGIYEKYKTQTGKFFPKIMMANGHKN